jgi:hypothetical protein
MIDNKPFAMFFNASPRNMRSLRWSKADFTSREAAPSPQRRGAFAIYPRFGNVLLK